MAGGVRHGAAATTPSRSLLSQVAEQACCCRFRWRRYGRSRSCLRGKLSRLERDAAGNWFTHIGQHASTADDSVHVADPVQAASSIPRSVHSIPLRSKPASGLPIRRSLAQYGLALPTLIVLFYAARQLDAFGPAGVRRGVRQPRPLCPTGAGWCRRNRCGVRAETSDRAAQGRWSGLVTFLRLMLLPGSRLEEPCRCRLIKSISRRRASLGCGIAASPLRWRSKVAMPIGWPAHMFSM